MPITAFAIKHPEGAIVVDTVQTKKIAGSNYTACDAVTGMFYRSNLQFSLAPEEEIGAQMRQMGIAQEQVSQVAMAQLHLDHMGACRRLGKGDS